jgi:DNA primase
MDILEILRDKISIVEVVSQKVSLQKKGREYTGCCPFHSEKTPSFYVNPQKGFYYCFGCGAKGNIFNFYMEIYRYSFKESVIELAKQFNITLPANLVLNQTPSYNQLFELTSLVNDYFMQNLIAPKVDSQKAYSYLLNRGLSAEIIKKFKIGYASLYNEEIFNTMVNKNIKEEDILETGLKSFSSHGEIYEFFRNRIIFPIFNIKNQIVAFGGRVLDDSKPKYLNSKESSIFHKKNTLFGLNFAIENLKNNIPLIVVEGYLDVISLHQYGFNTGVAPLGTALSVEHLELLNKYGKNPIFCFDSDIAGLKATHRIVDLYLDILDIGMNPKFLFLKEAKDPDEYLQKYGADSFKTKLNEAISISEFLLQEYTLGKNLDLPEVSSEVLNTLTSKVSGIKNQSLKYKFIEFFRNNVNFTGKNNNKLLYKNKNNTSNMDILIDKIFLQSQNNAILLVCVVLYPQLLPQVLDNLGNCSFENRDLEKLRVFFIENNEIILHNNIQNLLQKFNLENIVQNILNMPLIKHIIDTINSVEEAQKQFDFAYSLVLREYLEKEYKELLLQIKDLGKKKLQPIVQEIQEVDNKIKILQEKQKLILKEIKQLTKQVF